MKEAGLVMVGKSNAPENGWSIATEPVLYGVTLNPWSQKRDRRRIERRHLRCRRFANGSDR